MTRKANGADAGKHFKLVPFSKITMSKEPAYLVQGLIPREGLIVAWGKEKSGKSFWIYDLVMHIALNWKYRGRRVAAGPVAYIACEGERGLGTRTEAFRLARLAEQADDVPFYLLTTRLDLIDQHELLIHDIRAQTAVPPVAIVIDTLNRSLVGSEAKDEDMSAYIKALDAIREAFKAAVIVIHHCGIEEKRPRGHTSLAGAADAQIAIKRDEAGNVVATVEFMKDGAEGAEIRSKLQVVEVGQDKDGQPITSCCVAPADGQASARTTPKARQKLTDRQTIAMRAITNFFAEGKGEDAPASGSIPKGRKVSLRPIILETIEHAGVAKEVANSKRRREAVGRILESLQSRGIIGVSGDHVWLPQ